MADKTTAPSEGTGPNRKRYIVPLSPRTAEKLEYLRKRCDINKDSEVMRNALRLQYSLLKSLDAGKSILIKDVDGTISTLHELVLICPQDLAE